MSEVLHHDSGDQAPPQLTPEQIRNNEAGKVYARYICVGLEPWLEGPDYYRIASKGADPGRAIGVGGSSQTEGAGGGLIVLQAYEDIRELTIHVPPDNSGKSREYCYKTRYTPGLGYSPTEGDEIYVQRGNIGSNVGNTREPLRTSDLYTLGIVLESVAPYPEVNTSVKRQIEQIMAAPEANE
jgi:hypothetical protein